VGCRSHRAIGRFFDWPHWHGRRRHDDSTALVDRLGRAQRRRRHRSRLERPHKNGRRGACGSVPGALLGLYLLGILKKFAGVEYVDHLIVRLLGGTLMLVAVGIIFKGYIQRLLPESASRSATDENLKGWQVPLLGFIVGVLVSFTSVGSGSLIVTTLLLLFPGERLNRLVGSDVFHGVLIVGVAALGHWRLGDVNLPLVSGLLLGSIPGVWLGSFIASRLPEGTLRPMVAVLLFVTGAKLI
jgi:uncharacterized protein